MRERSLILATRSVGKVRELMPLLAQFGWTALTLDEAGIPVSKAEDDLEVFTTFEANALAKARYFARHSGVAVVADDSGLVVNALDGRPGVQSKRWSGSTLEGDALDVYNNRFLQARLDEAAVLGRTERDAAYVCAAACVWGDREWVAVGETAGRILREPVGSGGFGYDPYFWSNELGATFAAVERDAKAEVSHRGRAFRRLLTELESFFVQPVDPDASSG